MKKPLINAVLIALGLFPLIVIADNAATSSTSDLQSQLSSVTSQKLPTMPTIQNPLTSTSDSSQSATTSSGSSSSASPNTQNPLSSFTSPDSSSSSSNTQNPFASISPSSLPISKTRFAVEMQTGTRSIGTLDAMIPFLGNDDFIVYADMIAKGSLDNTFEGNLGLGFRRVNDAETAIYGAYAFYDILNSVNNNQFTQATIGFERLGLVWDFRANAYIPVGTTEYNTNVYTGNNGQVIETGHDWLAYMQTQTETASAGGDLEVGHTMGSKDVRGYFGVYSFGSDTTGPRLRVEYQYNDRIAFTGMAQYDQDRGAQYFFGLRFTVGGVRAINPNSIYSRMTDVVIRDIDVVTHETYSPVSDIIETNKMWVVDTTNGSDTGDGTVEHPYKSITDAIAAAPAGSVILVKGPGGQITTNLVLQPGQILWGADRALYWNFATNTPSYDPVAGTLLVQSATGGRQIINGSMTVASGDGIYNFDFNGTGNIANGIVINGMQNVTIQNVNVSNFTNDGIFVSGNSSQITLNQVNANNNTNAGLYVDTGSSVTGNSDTFNNNLYGVENNGSVNLSQTTFDSNTMGLYQNGSSSNSVIDDSAFTNNTVNGFYLADGNATITNSHFNDNQYGIRVLNGALSLSDSNTNNNTDDGLFEDGGSVDMENSTSNYNQGNGINILSGTFTAHNIALQHNTQNGLAISGASTAGTTVNIVYGDMSDNGANGVDIYSTIDSSTPYVTFDGNHLTLTDNGSDGFHTETASTVDLIDSTIASNGNNGITFVGGTLTLSGDASNLSSIALNHNDGIYITGTNDAVILNVTNTTIENNNNGIYVDNTNGTFAANLSQVNLIDNTNVGFAYVDMLPVNFVMHFDYVTAEGNGIGTNGMGLKILANHIDVGSYIKHSIFTENGAMSDITNKTNLIVDDSTCEASTDLFPPVSPTQKC